MEKEISHFANVVISFDKDSMKEIESMGEPFLSKEELIHEFIKNANEQQQAEAARARRLEVEKTSKKYRRILER